MNPVADPFVVRQPELPKGWHGAEGRFLGAEVGAAEEDRVNRVSNSQVHPCQVFQGDLGLMLEDPLYVVATALERHIPLANVTDSPGVLEKRRGHQGDIAQCGAAEACDHGPAGRTSEIHIGLDRGQVGLVQRLEFLEVVLDVQVLVAEVMLPDDRVEEVKSPGHSPARLGRRVALRIDQGIAVLAHRGVEHP